MMRTLQIIVVAKALLLSAFHTSVCQSVILMPDGGVKVTGSKKFISSNASVNPEVTVDEMVKLNYALLYGLEQNTGGIVAEIDPGGRVDVKVYSYDPTEVDGHGKLIYAVYSDQTSESSDFVEKSADLTAEGFEFLPITTAGKNIKVLSASAKIYVGSGECQNHFSSLTKPYHVLSYVLTRRSHIFGSSNEFNQFPIDCEQYTSSQPVIIETTVKDATIKKVRIPGIGDMLPSELFREAKFKVKISVSRNGQPLNEYVFFDDGGNGAGTYDAADKVSLVAGDEVTFEINSVNNPEIKGVPKIWMSGSMAQREFICTPDYGPNQIEPWCPFEIQTHYRKINGYPKGDDLNPAFVPTTAWLSEGPYTWKWTAQRETDADKTVYEQQVSYPKIKYFGTTIQRESQSIGWAKELLNYWETNSTSFDQVKPEYTGPKYLVGYDIDEVLYVGNKEHDTKVANWWQAGKGLLMINEYTETNKKDNWQHMWPSEAAVVNGVTSYPIEYDERGYPKRGEVLNDLITAYQKANAFRYFHDKDHPYLLNNYYYNGYEIEDFGTFWDDINHSSIVRPPDATTPAECQRHCWFHPHRSTGNNKHPGVVTIKAGVDEIQFRIEVKNPTVDQQLGFYNALTGPSHPLGFGQKSTFTLHSVPVDKKELFEIRLMSYNDGDGTVRIDAVATDAEGATFTPDDNGTTGKLSAEFPIYSGWTFIVAYYGYGDAKVPIAGHAPMIMDPLTSLTVPGSEPRPYDYQASVTCPPGFVDLKEGQGERPLETQNELRKNPDPSRGYTQAYGAAFAKPYLREYVFRPGEKVKFAAVDAGRKIETYWSKTENNTDDPYQSWRELSRRMPSNFDVDQPTDASRSIRYRLYKIEHGSRTEVTSDVDRYFERTFDEIGEYELEANFNGFFNDPGIKPATCKITIVPMDNEAHVADKFNERHKRGEIKLRYLNNDERLLFQEYATVVNANLDNYLVAEVSDLLSEYVYVTGPRATPYTHRFSDENVFNDVFVWSAKPENGDAQTVVSLTNPSFADTWLNGFDPLSKWPAGWGNTWLRHTSSNHFPIEEIDPATVLKDNTLNTFTAVMDFMFDATAAEQGNLGFLRWSAWIAPTPTDGDEFNRWIKPSMNLQDFFNSGDGAFSGNPYVNISNITNASEFTWTDYGSMASLPKDTEGRRFPDESKNQLKLYYDLKFGRLKIFENTEAVHEITVANMIPDFYGTDPTFAGIDEIFIGSTVNDLPPNPTNSLRAGIPILTFSAAEYGQTDLDTQFKISNLPNKSVTSGVVHQAFDRYLTATSNGMSMELSLFGPLCNDNMRCGAAPTPVAEYRDDHGIDGFEFRFKVPDQLQLLLNIVAYDDDGNAFQLYNDNGAVTASATLNATSEWQTFKLYFDPNLTSTNNTYSIPRKIVMQFSEASGNAFDVHLDDFYFTVPEGTGWTLPQTSSDLWQWYQKTAINYFLRNFDDVSISRSGPSVQAGVVPESSTEPDKISISGLGYAIACTMLAADKNMINTNDAKTRVLKMIRWIYNLNTDGGQDGWYGVPWHYIKKNYSGGSPYGNEPGQLSTIDWAMCMPALRVARERYPDNDSESVEIRTMVDELIDRTKWGRYRVTNKTPQLDAEGNITLDESGKPVMVEEDFKISMDCSKTGDPETGRMWGVSFSEESELVYAEAYATALEKQTKTGYVNNCSNGRCDDITLEYLSHITRKRKGNFYPSWFGVGFTYNWYQLWAGNFKLDGESAVHSPYYDNSSVAYMADYTTCGELFQQPFIGLTAAAVINKIYSDGWVDHNRYISNQGSFSHGTDDNTEVVQVAPAPYGNALAFPFIPDEATTSLSSYTALGYVHPIMGLPDNIQLANTAGLSPIPTWKQLDINVAPIALAIEQKLGGSQYSVAQSYLQDDWAKAAYSALLNTWSTHPPIDGQARIQTEALPKQSEITETELLSYPNPSHDGEFTLQFNIAEAGKFEGMLIDLNGKVISKPEWTFDKPGQYKLQFRDLAEVKRRGVFVLAIRGPRTRKLIKLIVH